MAKIINSDYLTKELLKIRTNSSGIVLAGGCFDILHKGHIEFLNKAKTFGETLIVLLESDQKVKEIKGPNRPINNQSQRAKILSGVKSVDYVILLKYLSQNQDYEILVKKIEPDIIAVSEGTAVYDWEKEYMSSKGGKVIQVIDRLSEYSTTKIADLAKL